MFDDILGKEAEPTLQTGKGEGDWSAEQQRIENDKTLTTHHSPLTTHHSPLVNAPKLP